MLRWKCARHFLAERKKSVLGAALSSASLLALSVVLTTQPARAANECGADGTGADTITCTGANFANGITYTGSDGLNLVLNNSAMTVTKGTSTDGINLTGTTTNDLILTATSLTSVNGGTGTAVTVSNGGDGKAAIMLNAGSFTSTAAQTIFATHASGTGDSVVTMNGGSAANTSISGVVYAVDAEVSGTGTGNATVLMTGGAVQTGGVNNSAALRAGISNAASAATASVTMSGGTMTGTGIGAIATTNGSGLVQVTINGGSITTGTGVSGTGGSFGAEALNTGSGNALVTLTSGSITSGNVFTASGLFASANTGTATASMTNGTIAAKGSAGAGLYAFSTAGPSTASMSGGSISNTATGAYGLHASLGVGSTAIATVLLNGGTVSTSGNNSYGLYAQATNGQAILQMTGGSVATSGSTAFGANATATGTGSASILLSGGSVTTTGGSAPVLRSLTVDGQATVQMTGGTVTASGPNAPGILASATGVGRYSISITGGTVTGGATVADAIRAVSSTGGTIVIGAGAIINGAASGTALNTSLGTGAAAITTAGTLTGAISLGTGTNTLSITGGSIAGNISGGGNTALSFDLGAGNSFTYDAAYAITGTNTVAMNSGIVNLAGIINAPAFALNGGTLSVASDANLGSGTGTLSFNGGILQVTGTSLTSTPRTISWGAGGGGFDIADAANVFTVDQALASGGALTKLGAGTLVLTQNNGYGGGTTIAAGILQLGSGGTAGSITGDVTDNGVLAFNRSDAVSFSGVISGAGAVSQIGTGTTTLSAVNNYSGGTIIAAGTLSGSATSFGSGAIQNNGALVIDQPADAVFANAINGTGSFTKLGAGRLNLTGTGSLSGPTTVAAGLLSVNGALASSAVTVQNGGSLGGNGTVGATIIQSGATIAPGNSIGTLHINGNFTQASGSVYRVEVDPTSNASDAILVTGAATVQSGAALQVTKYNPGEYQPGTVYTVLTASGGLTGTYAFSGDTTGASAFLALKDSYDANHVYLTVVQTQKLATAATTPNQQAVAQALDALPPTTPAATAALNSPDASSARAAFDQLSGQVSASAQGALLANGLYVRDVALDRLRDVVCVPTAMEKSARDGRKLSLWGQGFGGWGGIAGNGNAGGLNHSAAGFLVGADIPAADWRLGFFGGYSRSDFNIVSGGATGGSNDYHLGAYGGTLLGDVALRLGASYSWSGITTDRAVLIGTFADALHGVYNGDTTQVFGELGYRMAMDRFSLEPFANLTYVGLTTSGFTEAGGSAALTVRANTTENMIATLGLRPSMDVDMGGFGATLRGMLGWRRTFGTVVPDAQVSFAGGNPFSVSGAPIARDAAAVEAGLDVTLEEGMTLGLTYGGQFSNRTTDQTARGTIRISF